MSDFVQPDGELNLPLWETHKTSVAADTWSPTRTGALSALSSKASWENLAQAPIYVEYASMLEFRSLSLLPGDLLSNAFTIATERSPSLFGLQDFAPNHIFVLSHPSTWGGVERHSLLKHCADIFQRGPSPAVLQHIVAALLDVHQLDIAAASIWGETEALQHVCDRDGCQDVIRWVVRT